MAALTRKRPQNATAPLPTPLLPLSRRRPQRRCALLPHNRLRKRHWSHWEVARRQPRCSFPGHCPQRAGAVRKANSADYDRNLTQLVHGEYKCVPHDETRGFDLDSSGLASPGTDDLGCAEVAGEGGD
jgi:hypothetical protein